MKKILVTLLFIGLIKAVSGQTADLNGVTFGFGAGYSYSNDQTFDYSLTTDGVHNLKIQPLSKKAFVISSVVMVKLGKIAFNPGTNTFVKQAQKSVYDTVKAQNDMLKKKLLVKIQNLKNAMSNQKLTHSKEMNSNQLDTVKNDLTTLDRSTKESTGMHFYDHLSINLALDLANIAPNVSFNKNINGGIGLGYFLTDNLQLAVFYDISQIAQLRDYVVNDYQDKPIPNGSGTFYNSLSTSDSNLFYTKTVSGISFKLIFSLANKKASQ